MCDTKSQQFPHHSVENHINLSQALFCKNVKNFRENNAVIEFFGKISLEITQSCIFTQICAKMALAKVKD